MPLLDHLIELRKRLIYALVGFFLVFFITFYFAKPIFSFLIQPALSDGYKVIVLDIFEFFFVTVKLSGFVALIVGFPLIAVQIWLFVAPGLYRHEKTLRSSDYLERILQLVFAFGFAFEVPVLLTLLVQVGIVTTEGLRSKRRYAIVVAFIVAAVLTPPDVVSQLALAIPLLVFYELSIVIGRVIERKRDAADKKAEADELKAEEAEKTAEEEKKVEEEKKAGDPAV